MVKYGLVGKWRRNQEKVSDSIQRNMEVSNHKVGILVEVVGLRGNPRSAMKGREKGKYVQVQT